MKEAHSFLLSSCLDPTRHPHLCGAHICKRLRSPEADSKKSIPPAYAVWQAGTSNQGCLTGPPGWESTPGLLKGLQIRALVHRQKLPPALFLLTNICLTSLCGGGYVNPNLEAGKITIY
jgi:hypothetical protein